MTTPGRAGDGLGEVEEGGVFGLAEVGGAVELLEDDEAGAGLGGLGDVVAGEREVGVEVVGAGVLEGGDGEGAGGGRGGHGQAPRLRVPSGICMVRQWRLPPCWRRERQSMGTMVRPEWAAAMTASASASRGSR